MNIKRLHLRNVGPFHDAFLEFPKARKDGSYPVTIITGENGTGKSVIIDAVRALFRLHYGIERDIVANKEDFLAEISLGKGEEEMTISVNSLLNGGDFHSYNPNFANLFVDEMNTAHKVDWVIDYWSSYLGTDSFKISSLTSIKSGKALHGALDNQVSNVKIIEFISSVDYLRTSDDKDEREEGEFVYTLIKEIFENCLLNGTFKSMSRKTLSPVLTVNGEDISMDKLSSGNLILIERLVTLLSRMYGICDLNSWPISKLKTIPGILLIDEVENHLHPKWQKRILNIIQSIFPCLQIIVTTHSPFVVSSTKDATVFVCKSKGDYSEVQDESNDYSNLPVDEVLNTPVFNVGPFSTEITDLLAQRKQALKDGDGVKVKKYTDELLRLNEDFFSFYKTNEETAFYDYEAH